MRERADAAAGPRGISWATLLVLAMATVASAQGPSPTRPAAGRGFVFAGGLSGGQISFPASSAFSLAVGDVSSYSAVGSTLLETRSARVVPSGASVGADRVVPFPAREGGFGLVMDLGYAFSPRLAVLVDVDLLAGVSSESFSQIMGGFVVRYSPTSRLWVQAGPASGEVNYGFTNPGDTTTGLPGVSATTEDGAVSGHGFLAAAGVSVLRKPSWSLDVQARYGKCWYQGFQGTNLSLAVTVGRWPLRGAAARS